MKILAFAEPEYTSEARILGMRIAANGGDTNPSILNLDPLYYDPEETGQYEPADVALVPESEDFDAIAEAHDRQHAITDADDEPLYGSCRVVRYDPENALEAIQEDEGAGGLKDEDLRANVLLGLEDADEDGVLHDEDVPLDAIAARIVSRLVDGERYGEIPEDFPGAQYLRDHGLDTLDEVRAMDDLTEVSGIGDARAEEIREALG